jgi:hypothetical protein
MKETITLPLNQFAPDRSPFDPNFIDVAQNVIPYENHFGPFPSFEAFTDPVPARPQGAFLAVHGSGDWIPFVGTANKIYKLAANNSWVDVSGATGPYATPASGRWSSTQYGNYVIFTNGVDDVLYFDTSLITDTFKPLSADAPRAKVVSTIGDFLILGNLTDVDDGDRAVWWSGLNDPFWWTPKQRSSDFQIFPDDGEIMAMSGFEKGIVIIHEHCIREGVLALDSALVMTFQKTIENHGIHARNSAVTTGAGTFYLSQDGFYRYATGQPPTRIGVERVDEFFFRDCALADTFYQFGWEDPARKIIYWAYRSTENQVSQTYDRMIVYNYGVDRFAQIKMPFVLSQIGDGVTRGYTLETLDTVDDLDALAFSLDNRAWSGSLPTFAAFDDEYRMGFFSGPPMEAILQTPDVPLVPGRRAYVSGFTPLCDATSTQGRVNQQDFHGKPGTWLPEFDASTITGEVPTRSTGRLHRFEVTIPEGAGWSAIHGVEVKYAPEGNR